MKINTVAGPLDTTDLGPTLMHEHVSCADWSMRMNFGRSFFKYEKVVETAVAMFTKMSQECGIKTVVDGTPVNLGRDVRLIKEVADRTGLNFVVSGGFYYQEEPGMAFLPQEALIDLMLEECQNGVAGTLIVPGIMKTAVGAEVTPYLEKILSAVGQVAAQTGLPLFCHHNVDNRNGGQILDIFEAQGMAPNKIILGHSGDTDNLEYLLAMLDRGCYIGMDRFGYCDIMLSLERRVATIAALCKQGFTNRMFLSHDLAAQLFFDGSSQGRPDFTFIHKTVLPALLESGVTQAQIDEMLNDNPRRFFDAS